MLRRFLLPLVVAVLLTTSLVHAQEGTPRSAELELVDGTKLRGEVLAETDQVVTFRMDGITRAYARSRIAAVRSVPPDETAAEVGDAPGTAAKAEKRERKAATKALSADALEWLGVLVGRLDTADEQVRGSVTKAILALGPGAREPLERAAEGASPVAAETIGRVLERLRGRDAKGNATPTARRPADAPDEPMEPGAREPVIAEAGARQAAERLRAELGLDEDAATAVLELVVEFRAGQVKLARAKERLDARKYERRSNKLITRAVERLAPRLDPAAIVLLRERLKSWQTPAAPRVSE